MKVKLLCFLFTVVEFISCQNVLLQDCDNLDECDFPPTTLYGHCEDTRDLTEACQPLTCSEGCTPVADECKQSCQPILQFRCIMTGDLYLSAGFDSDFVNAFSSFLSVPTIRIAVDETDIFQDYYDVVFEVSPDAGGTSDDLFYAMFDEFGFDEIWEYSNAILTNVLKIECMDGCQELLELMDDEALGRLRGILRDKHIEQKIHEHRLALLEGEAKKLKLLEREDILLTGIIEDTVDTFTSAWDLFEEHADRDIDRFHQGLHDSTSDFTQAASDVFNALFPGVGDPEFTFNNYGETIRRNPDKTFTPTSEEEVIDAVKEAIDEDKRVRCAAGGIDGEAHSWNDIFCDDGEYLLNTRNFNQQDDIVKNSPIDDPRAGHEGDMVTTVTMPPQVTCLQMIDFFLDNDASIPFDVILTWVTMGGTTATSSHGGGWDTPNLSDLIYKMTVVNSDGEAQEIDYEDILLGAGNSLGLWGPITSLTMFVNTLWKMEVLNQYIPMDEVWPRTGDDFDVLQSIVADNYYNEIFLFPFGEESDLTRFDVPTCHVMTMNRAADDAPIDHDKIPQYTSATERIKADVGNAFWEFVDTVLDESLDAHAFLSGTSYLELPTNDPLGNPYVIPLPNALHYVTFIHEIKTDDTEFAFPISADNNGIADFSAVRDAWYAMFDHIYDLKDDDEFPVDGPLEIRFTGKSDVVLSPAHHDREHTGWLELLSGRENQLYYDFVSETLVPEWWEIEPEARPHWGKWSPGQIDTEEGLAAREKIKELFADDIETFLEAREAAGVDPGDMFMNDFLADIFGIGNFTRSPTSESFANQLSTSVSLLFVLCFSVLTLF